ncbi:hypothetical protein GSI_13606 [Ganoderma sinense ZZ0214-1]|uniref:Uncharacterized protein n=1 Tax=Ganoderma sinense ZZ0214-1 TaxID=1077348 RepID=A0A2G8RQR5_9APHY|nr:hypothetical protein GSI_13606 [Ganoderma sinense ZZ0214-1]
MQVQQGQCQSLHLSTRVCARLAISCENSTALSDATSESTGTMVDAFNLEQWKLHFKFQTPRNLRGRMPFI